MEITERHLAVTKTARYALLGKISPATRDIWIVCHGFGQLANEFIAAFEPIAGPELVVIAPEALSRFYKSEGTVHTPDTPVGATWMTSADRDNEIADYVSYLDCLMSNLGRSVGPKVRVTVLGFSQGAATVSRWVARSRPPIAKLVLWGGLLPPDLRSPAKIGGVSKQPMHFVVGRSDRYFNSQLVEHELLALQGLGIPVSLTQFEGGHSIDPKTLTEIASIEGLQSNV